MKILLLLVAAVIAPMLGVAQLPKANAPQLDFQKMFNQSRKISLPNYEQSLAQFQQQRNSATWFWSAPQSPASKFDFSYLRRNYSTRSDYGPYGYNNFYRMHRGKFNIHLNDLPKMHRDFNQVLRTVRNKR